MDNNPLDGLDAAQRAEVAQTLRGMRVLQDDRGIASVMNQEAEFMGSGIQRLQQVDPVQAKEVKEAMIATFAARSQLEAEVTADSYARTASPARRSTAKFLQTMRQAHAGDAAAMAGLEHARDELRDAEAVHGTPPAALPGQQDPATLPAYELAAYMTRAHEVGVRQSGASNDDKEAAKATRKVAEFEAMRAHQAEIQKAIDKDAADKVVKLRRRDPEPVNEIEAEGGGSRIKINPTALPDHFADKYEKKGNALVRIGDDPKKALLKDHGAKLTANKDYNSEAIKAMVDIAEARGWNSLTVTGSPDFRKAVWNEAAARGLSVKGYKRTEAEQARIDKELARNGKQNALAENKTVKAFKEARTPEQRREAVTKHPELKGAFAVDAAAQAFARERLQGKSQEAFMERMRDNIAFDLAQGREMATIRLLAPMFKDQNTFIKARQPHRDVGRER